MVTQRPSTDSSWQNDIESQCWQLFCSNWTKCFQSCQSCAWHWSIPWQNASRTSLLLSWYTYPSSWLELPPASSQLSIQVQPKTLSEGWTSDICYTWLVFKRLCRNIWLSIVTNWQSASKKSGSFILDTGVAVSVIHRSLQIVLGTSLCFNSKPNKL